MMQHRVISYNVLSSHLADPEYFSSCNAEYLSADFRFTQLCILLDREIAEKSIICLQEVSAPWLARLHPFFTQYHYHVVSSNYGDKSSGYMGVVIAVPLESYQIINADIIRIADIKSVITGSSKQYPQHNVWTALMDCIRFALGRKSVEEDPWKSATRQPHTMITLQVRCLLSHDNFCVATYHMPCEYQHPQVMVIHAALAAQHLQTTAAPLPYVLAGDFNILPESSMYRLLTEGSLESSCPDRPPPLDGDSWEVNVDPMRSAYAIAQGREPDFTNYAKVRNEEPFIGTLDYIFLSKEWEIIRVEPLPTVGSVNGPLPNRTQPSDHILIAAQISLLRKPRN